MSTDPRVEAVAAALVPLDNPCEPENECYFECSEAAFERMTECAEVAVAALDAHDNSAGSLGAYRRQVEADVRERIAAAIDAEAFEFAHNVHDPQCADCQAIVSLTLAARIARGQA